MTFSLDDSQLLYNKILADHSTRLGKRTNFNAITTNNTKTLYTEDGVWTEGGKPVYYFAGNALDNWVYFGDLYWRIIRINEDNSVRLLYVGADTTTTNTYISISEYNINYGNTMYVGYMYGSSGSLDNNRNNINNSTIKTTIDNWYRDTLYDKYNGFVSQTAIYCNDRSTESYSSNSSMSYAPSNRSNFYRRQSYACGIEGEGKLFSNASNADKFSVSTASGGNGNLTYPIGLMTIDEVIYAGCLESGYCRTWINYNSLNKIVMSGYDLWTMSPHGTGNDTWAKVYRSSDNSVELHHTTVSHKAAVRPVLSLKSCVTWTSGDGTSNNPYKVSLNSACANAVN